MRILITAVTVCVCLVWWSEFAVARDWQDASGKFRIDAEFIAFRNGKVVLEKKDGSLISVPLERLCQSDQDFVRSLPGVTVPAASPAGIAPTPSQPNSPEEETLAQGAHAVLKTHCYRCHGQEGASEGGFNFALNLDKLKESYVKPRNTSGSLLWERMTSSDESAMPPPGEDPRPSATEMNAVKAWIEAGAPSLTMQQRKFIDNDQVVKAILADIRESNERSRRFLRYFTLTHLYNGGVSEDELQTYRNAFAKLVNSLSWNSNILVPTAIDAERTILRVDIRQVNWSAEVWEEIENANPYFLNMSTPDALACHDATQAKMPYLRVDWFVFAASKPPLYHAILGIPNTDTELERNLRVNVEANIDQEQVIRAGFNRSGVSQNNRMIERHAYPSGSYWKSYDFGGNVGQQNLFEHPLGPSNVDEPFKHDGGEIIFSLPNGMQGYMLVDNRGKRIDKGPTEIVSDPKQLDKSVTNGVSCMSCHYGGVIPKTDEIGPFVKANLKAFENSEDVLALYREPTEMNQLLAEDAKRFTQALDKIGIKSLSRSGEPISAMASRFEQELDLNMVACEFGLPAPEFSKRLVDSDAMARSFGALRTSGGTIKRDVFATMFGKAAVEFRLTIEGSVSIGRSNSVKSKFKDEGVVGEIRRFGDLGWGVESLAFSPNGEFLAAGKMDRALLLFDVEKGARLVDLPKLELLGQVQGCAFTPDGSRLLASGSQGLVLIWEVNKNGQLKPQSQFAGHSKGVACLAISDDSRLVLSGGDEHKVRLWKLDGSKELGVFDGFEGRIKACRISSNGRIGWATDGATLLQIDLQKCEVTKRTPLTRSWAAGQAAAISPDGRYVAAGDSYDIRVWELDSGRELPRLEGNNEIQWGMTFTPDGTRLVSGGSGKINIWNMKNQRKIGSLPVGMHVYVKSIATSPDNKHVAAIGSSAGQAIQVLRIPDAEK